MLGSGWAARRFPTPEDRAAASRAQSDLSEDKLVTLLRMAEDGGGVVVSPNVARSLLAMRQEYLMELHSLDGLNRQRDEMSQSLRILYQAFWHPFKSGDDPNKCKTCDLTEDCPIHEG